LVSSGEPPLPEGYARRPVALDDVGSLTGVANRSDDALGLRHDATESFLRWVLPLPFIDHDRDTVIVEGAAGAAGFGIAIRDPASEGSELHWTAIVDPAQRGRGLGRWLVNWALSVAERRAAEGPFEVRTGVPRVDRSGTELIRGAGFRHVRTNWEMHRDFPEAPEPGEPPEDVSIRTFETGRDERTLWQLNESAFSEHFGFTPTPYESFESELYAAADWRPERALLAERDGDVVGAVVWVEAGPDGYIPTVGVLAPHRGRGIAQALLRRAFADIAAAGFTGASLHVDSENATGAVELYRKVGMEPIRETLTFQRT
jgi:mycothiol synthase